MSSVKRRKTDEGRPSGLVEKKNKVSRAVPEPALNPSSPDAEQNEPEPVQANVDVEAEVEKSFKELVS
jgi:hypothetical protein